MQTTTSNETETPTTPETPPGEDSVHGLLDRFAGMEGIWSSPGAYTIEWQDEEHVRVTKHWREFDDVAIIAGGDFETILETLFVGAKIERVSRPSNKAITNKGSENDA